MNHDPMPPQYSIIIPAYNEAAELPQTLAAIHRAMRAQKVRGECIVVDNNSTDDTAETAIREGADLVVFEPMNQIARARNAGAKASRAAWLVFVDADTRISSEILAEALHKLDSNRCVGGGGVVHFEGKTSKIGRFGIQTWEFLSKRLKIAAGSFLFCRRDAFEAIGGFDEKLYASEEVRLSRQLKRWGRRRKLEFVILDRAPIQTSARKLDWYSGPQIIAWVLFMLIAPIAVRSRRLCGFWYKRPATRPSEASATK